MRKLGNLILGVEPKLRARVGMTLLAMWGYVASTGLLIYLVQIGMVPSRTAMPLVAFMWTGVPVFYVLVRTGLSRRLGSPGMDLPQCLFAMASILIAYVIIGPERNPGKEIVYLNYAAVDPDLTNSKCSYWHYRLDADTSMKMEALTSFIKEQKDVHKVYLINQNYAHGQQVSKFAKSMLARKRADIQIVGDDLHPLAQVRDFAPYVAKIKASGADTVITGNWGSDLALLVKAANEAGLNVNFYTYYANFGGTPTALGKAASGRVYQVGYGHYNMGGLYGGLVSEFKKRFNDDFYNGASYHALMMLSEAMAKAKSTDPLKVAAAMEGLKFKSFNGEVEMRKTDHQLQQPLFIAKWAPVDAKDSYDVEKTGMTFVPLKSFDSYVSSTPTSCQMKRPS